MCISQSAAGVWQDAVAKGTLRTSAFLIGHRGAFQYQLMTNPLQSPLAETLDQTPSHRRLRSFTRSYVLRFVLVSFSSCSCSSRVLVTVSRRPVVERVWVRVRPSSIGQVLESREARASTSTSTSTKRRK